MSLLAPRFGSERASVVLPHVTCSSCLASIPLSSLGEHVCQSHARVPPRPSQIAIPKGTQGSRGTLRLETSPVSTRPPFAGPSSAHPSPIEYSFPRRPSPNGQTPLSNAFPSAFSNQIWTPSPVNPAFPKSAGSYSSAPPEMVQMPDTTMGGESGMAGVGRRAFAAAAWGVRAGVALAKNHAETPHQNTAPAPWQHSSSRPELYHSYTTPIPQRSQSVASQAPTGPPPRSHSAMSQRAGPVASSSHVRSNPSVSSIGSSSAWAGPAKPSNKRDFFEKVKELNGNGSLPVRNDTLNTPSSGEKVLVASPTGTAFDLEDDLDNIPPANAKSNHDGAPELRINTKPLKAGNRMHHRYPTSSSDVSSHSSLSSKSGRYGTSGPESEEIVTPSQSYEGLEERAAGDIGRNILQQIREDEEDRDVFGTSPCDDTVRGYSEITKEIRPSDSISTVTSSNYHISSGGYNPTLDHKRTESLSHRRTASQKSDSITSYTQTTPAHLTNPQRKRKTCQKCGEMVGGSKRFVERDGVVLCERDWKKLYLPSCRKCNLPIEKSAVSSSDGQLKGKWHRACFTCTRCDKPFDGDDFYVLDGKPWCQYHYHEANGTLCASHSCRQPIEGPCIALPGSNPLRFHPNHLRCDHRGVSSGAQTCHEPMDEYYELSGKRYCERHAGEAVKKLHRSGGQGKAEKRRTRLIELPVAY
nr:hypothetical protein L204_04402 [Cryptococcus depauperatus CBS 7855]